MTTPAPDTFQSGAAIPVEAIPEALRPRIGPSAPDKARLLTARALLPMPPDQLGVALGILARDPLPDVAEAAKASLKDLPRNVVEGIVASDLPGPVLDVYAHVFVDDQELAQALITNRATLDASVGWLARHGRGALLDGIASNQVRLVRSPRILEAMLANPAAPTPVLARVVETAIRNDVPTGHIVGFKELAEAFFSDLAEQRAKAAPPKDPKRDEPAEEFDPDKASELLEKEAEDTLVAAVEGRGVDEAKLEELLAKGEEGEEGDDDKAQGEPLWKLIESMSVPQKVRLALMGDATARKILVRDKKRVVAQSVLRSPKVTEKEIATFAMDKALDGEIIRVIARNREWTRNYPIMLALVMNPKTPPQVSLGFLKSLRRRDLQQLARAKDVPGHVIRAARQLKDTRAGN